MQLIDELHEGEHGDRGGNLRSRADDESVVGNVLNRRGAEDAQLCQPVLGHGSGKLNQMQALLEPSVGCGERLAGQRRGGSEPGVDRCTGEEDPIVIIQDREFELERCGTLRHTVHNSIRSVSDEGSGVACHQLGIRLADELRRGAGVRLRKEIPDPHLLEPAARGEGVPRIWQKQTEGEQSK
ncbi:MAG TPA: hypothetical protein VNN08_06165 [Thermoanaerobaculia bacterium]|nr:hypothetical protein [Thermoanaerobaculia bacterium]